MGEQLENIRARFTLRENTGSKKRPFLPNLQRLREVAILYMRCSAYCRAFLARRRGRSKLENEEETWGVATVG